MHKFVFTGQLYPVEPIMKINNEWQVTNNQQEVVSLFEKFIAQLANKLPTKVKPFLCR